MCKSVFQAYGLLVLLLMPIAVQATPDWHQVLAKSPNLANVLYSNQIQQESKVENGVIYSRQQPGGRNENAISELFSNTMFKFDSRFKSGVNPYWTFHIRLARVNSGSKWHNFAKNLPTGIQTIKRRIPTHWMGERVTSWSDVQEFKVIVY